MKGVHVLLLNWNGWGDTLECLESLLRSDCCDLRVVVCDNGSTDGSLARLKAWARGDLDLWVPDAARLKHFSFPPVAKPVPYVQLSRKEAEAGGAADCAARLILIDNGSNLGFAGGNNVGLRYLLRQDDLAYVWLLNNDTVVRADALGKLLARVGADPQAGMCGSTLLCYQDPGQVQAHGGAYYCRWIGLAWHLGRLKKAHHPISAGKVEARMNYVVGASMLVSQRFLREIGLLCEDYFLFFEELDWALRAAGRFNLLYAPQSVVYHKVGASVGTSSNPAKKSAVCDYWNVRNRLFFTRRWFPEALPAVYLALLGTLLTRVVMGRWDRVAMLLRLLTTGGATR